MAINVTIVGSQDLVLEERLRSADMRPTSVGTAALATLGHPTSTPPEVVVLDLRSTNEIPPILASIKRQHPDVGLIIVASTLDPALMLEAMRAGVTECITNIEGGDLEAAVNRVVAQRASPISGEVFVFVGAKGGVGTTTIATNVATALAKIGSTLVIDLHLAGGDAGLFLGADSRFSVIDALENTHRLDDAFFRQLVSHSKAGPDLLASADRVAMPTADPARVRTLVEYSAQSYRFTVLDVPRWDAGVLDSLEAATTIVVAANQELATIRSAARLAKHLRQRYGKEKVVAVLSRPDRLAEIPLDDLEAAIGGSIRHTFPGDYRLAIGALNRGRPIVVEGRAALASAFRVFAQQLSGADGASAAPTSAKGTSLFGRLTGRR